jgi:hypothetical protein
MMTYPSSDFLGIDIRTSRQPGVLEDIKDELQRFLRFIKERDIPLVVAAGNAEQTVTVEQNYPQGLSTPDDSMVIVGAVDQAGKPWDDMSKDTNNLITTYAPGVQIEAPTVGNEKMTESGTSQATAIVVSGFNYVR